MVKVGEGEYTECQIGGDEEDASKNKRWGAHLEDIKIQLELLERERQQIGPNIKNQADQKINILGGTSGEKKLDLKNWRARQEAIRLMAKSEIGNPKLPA